MRESNFPRKSSYKGPRNRRAAEQLRKKKQRMILGGVGAAAAVLIAAIVFWPEKEEKKTEAVIAETESTEAPVRKSVTVDGISLDGMNREEAKKVLMEKHPWNLQVAREGENGESTEAPVRKSVTVDGISLDGMNREEAKKVLMEKHPWNLQVAREGENGRETLTISNMAEPAIDNLLDEIFASQEGGTYILSIVGEEAAIEAEVAAVARAWDVKAQNTKLDHFDNSTGKYVFTEGKSGKLVDQEKLTADIEAVIASGNYRQTIDVSFVETTPENSDKVKAEYKTLATFTTNTTSNSKRNTNVRLAAEALNGTIVQPGAPENSDKVKAEYKTLATFTTNTTSNSKRNTNVRLAAEALNGTIVQPGEEFSFNKVVGQRTAEKGYQAAAAYSSGEVVQEIGGGVCQISSTMYRVVFQAGMEITYRRSHTFEPQAAAAYSSGEVVQEIGGGVCQISSTMYRVVFQAGMEITYRRSHTFEPNYVTPGQDAAISWEQPDFKFINRSKGPICIRASYADQKATVSIYGIPVLEDGITWDLYSEKTGEVDPPEPTYIEDQTLEPGTEKVQKAGSNGTTWVTYKVVYKDGKEIERVKDHEKTYKGHAAVIRRNTSPVKLTPEETKPAAETTAAPSVDGMPDEYVPGEDMIVEPEPSLEAPEEEEVEE